MSGQRHIGKAKKTPDIVGEITGAEQTKYYFVRIPDYYLHSGEVNGILQLPPMTQTDLFNDASYLTRAAPRSTNGARGGANPKAVPSRSTLTAASR